MELLIIVLGCFTVFTQMLLLKDIVKEKSTNRNLELNNRLLTASIIDEGKYLEHEWEYLGIHFTATSQSSNTYRCTKCSMIHRVSLDLDLEGFYVNGAKSVDYGCRVG